MACNENIIKNIAMEISRECAQRNSSVDTDYATFLVEHMLLNPTYGKLVYKSINRAKLETLVTKCVDLILENFVPMTTLKMQFMYRNNYDKLEVMAEEHLQSIENMVKPLLNEILDQKVQPGDEEMQYKLIRKIAIYTVLATGLGNPYFIVTLKEAVAALESVFPMEDVVEFVCLDRVQRKDRLVELLELVSGVRLFNRDVKRGGELIPDLPFSLCDASSACLKAIESTLARVRERLHVLTSATYGYVDVDVGTGNVNVTPHPSLGLDDFEYIYDVIAFLRQYESITLRLLGDMRSIKSNTEFYIDKLKSIFEELHEVLKYKSAVPVIRVFPLFKKVWLVWRAMQVEMYLVSTINRLLTILENLMTQMNNAPTPDNNPQDVLNVLMATATVLTDEQRRSRPATHEDRSAVADVKGVVFPDAAQLSIIKIQYEGMCAMSVCAGSLVPCSPQLGLYAYGGRHYGFCCSKFLVAFAHSPLRYIHTALEVARGCPSLIYILNVYDDVLSVRHQENLTIRVEHKQEVATQEIQTEVHPIPEYKDKDYHWNMWEHKRRACQMASIVNCRTHSTQTVYSTMRREIQCQTQQPRDKHHQTTKTSWTSVETPNTFLWGLRGQLNDGQHVMDLTLKPRCTQVCSTTSDVASTSTGNVCSCEEDRCECEEPVQSPLEVSVSNESAPASF